MKIRDSSSQYWAQDRLLKCLFVFGLVMVTCALITDRIPLLKRHQLVVLVSALAAVVALIFWWERSEQRMFDRIRKKLGTTADALDNDIRDGVAEVTTFEVTDAINVKEAEDEGSSYFLAVGPGKMLFLSGQYLYEYEDEKHFPSTRFQLIRAAKSKTFLDLKCLGQYLPPSFKRPAFTKADFAKGAVPQDGEIINADFEALKKT